MPTIPAVPEAASTAPAEAVEAAPPTLAAAVADIRADVRIYFTIVNVMST
jgi:hypothetical protein